MRSLYQTSPSPNDPPSRGFRHVLMPADCGQMLTPADFDEDGTLDLSGEPLSPHESLGEATATR